MALISFQLDDSEVRKILDKAAHVTDNMTVPMQKAGIYILRQTDLHFRNESGPDGKWQDIKPATKKRRRKGKGGQILQDRGTLRNSTTPRGGAYQVFDVDEKSVEVGVSGLAYANIHQFGGIIKREAGNMLLRHQTTPTGKLKHRGNLLIFARKHSRDGKKPHKNFLERSFSHGAYSIRIPARPYLYLTEKDAEAINGIFIEWGNKMLFSSGGSLHFGMAAGGGA